MPRPPFDSSRLVTPSQPWVWGQSPIDKYSPLTNADGARPEVPRLVNPASGQTVVWKPMRSES